MLGISVGGKVILPILSAKYVRLNPPCGSKRRLRKQLHSSVRKPRKRGKSIRRLSERESCERKHKRSASSSSSIAVSYVPEEEKKYIFIIFIITTFFSLKKCRSNKRIDDFKNKKKKVKYAANSKK